MHAQGAVPGSSGSTLGSARRWKQTGLCLILQFPGVGVSFLVTWTLSQELPHCLEQACWSKSRKVTFTQWNVQVFPFVLWSSLQHTAIRAAHRSRSWRGGLSAVAGASAAHGTPKSGGELLLLLHLQWKCFVLEEKNHELTVVGLILPSVCTLPGTGCRAHDVGVRNLEMSSLC